MSIHETIQFRCPECDTEGDALVWSSINAALDPEAREDLMEGKINSLHCANCGFRFSASEPLLYHDPQNEFCVYFFPFRMVRDDNFFDGITKDGLLDAVSNLPGMDALAYFRNTHLVFSMDELSRHVLFREALAKHYLHGGADS